MPHLTSTSHSGANSDASVLPQEIIDQILEQLVLEDTPTAQRDLASCLLVHSTFYLIAHHHLFAHISFTADAHGPTQTRAQRLLDIYEAKPFLLSVLRNFTLNINCTFRDRDVERMRPTATVQAPKAARRRFSMLFASRPNTVTPVRTTARLATVAEGTFHFQDSLLEKVATAPFIKVLSIQGDFNWSRLSEKTKNQLLRVGRNPSLKRLELTRMENVPGDMLVGLPHVSAKQFLIRDTTFNTDNAKNGRASAQCFVNNIESLEVTADFPWRFVDTLYSMFLGLALISPQIHNILSGDQPMLFNNLTALIVRVHERVEGPQWYCLIGAAPRLESLEIQDMGMFSVADYDTSLLTPAYVNCLRNVQLLRFRTLTRESLGEQALDIYLGFFVQILRTLGHSFEQVIDIPVPPSALSVVELFIATRSPLQRCDISPMPRPVKGHRRTYMDPWSLLDQELSGGRTQQNIFPALWNVNVTFLDKWDRNEKGIKSSELLPRTSASGVEVTIDRKLS